MVKKTGSGLVTLTAADIFAAHDEEIKEVEVPEWGGVVYVKGMTGAERDRYEKTFMEWREKKGKLTNMRASMLVMCLVDENGRRLFTSSSSDIEALGAKSAKVLDRLWDVARDMCGMTTEDVEELAGESGATEDADSTLS